MRLALLFGMLLVAATPSRQLALPQNVREVETFRGITQYRLESNGMTLLLVPSHASPVFTFMVVYHVGSRNEAPGHTGSAHLLEHMIFNKSTENFGRAKGHKTFQEVLYQAGADFSSTNMTTWYDRMNGYSTLPSDKLQLAMEIEADRLGRGLILDSERQPEMSVVRNEYEIGENNPNQALLKAVVSTVIQAHPYHWSTIGYRSDIEGVTTEKLREHYKNFFWPNNAEAILVGDFDTQKAIELFDRTFGGFKRSPHPIPQVITVEPPQEGERRTVVRRNGNVGLVMLGYIRPGATHQDFIPLEVLTTILGEGVNSRLYQALVEKQLASDATAFNLTLRDPFPLLINATALPGRTHGEVEAAVKKALEDVVEKGVTDEEVRRAQQQIEVAVIRARDGTFPFTAALGESVASTDWKWFLTYVDRIKAVTALDVKRVAATYFVPEHATVGWFVPLDNSKTAAPAPAPASATAPAASLAAVEHPAATSKTGTPPAPGRTSFSSRTVRKVLRNGIVVDVLENHSNPTVAIRGLVFAGDSSAANRAVPDLTARMLQRGTATRAKEQIAALLANAGATRSYQTTLFQSDLALDGLSRDLALLLDVLADEVRNPAFTAEELVKAKAELKTNILRADESTSLRATERLTQLVYPEGHPYRSAGRERMVSDLENVTADLLRQFHRSHYAGANMILAVVGDVDANATIAMIEKSLGNLPAGTRYQAVAARTAGPPEARREAVTMRGKANMNLIIGAASGLRRTDPDWEAAIVANAALGQNSLSSRLGRRVRDTEGLSYNLNSRFSLTDALDGVWLANVNVAPQNLQKALASTMDEIRKFVREGITDEELEIQKSFFAGNFNVGLGSNAGIAASLLTAEKFGYGPTYLDSFPTRIRSVTKAQVSRAIQERLHADRLHVVVAGDLDRVPD